MIDYRSVIGSESDRLADIIESGDPDARVAGCPEWSLHELGVHMGDVQRWATRILTTGERDGGDYAPPGNDNLSGWLRDGTAALLAAIDASDPDAPCWNFHPNAEQVTSFWYRRQALEVALHRWDAEVAATGSAVPIAPVVAADAVDEWVHLIIARVLNREGVDTTALVGDVHFHCTDTEGEWTFEAIDGELVIVNEHRKSAVAAKGTASDLALFCYNRGPSSELQIFGDTDLLDRWMRALTF